MGEKQYFLRYGDYDGPDNDERTATFWARSENDAQTIADEMMGREWNRVEMFEVLYSPEVSVPAMSVRYALAHMPYWAKKGRKWEICYDNVPYMDSMKPQEGQST